MAINLVTERLKTTLANAAGVQAADQAVSGSAVAEFNATEFSVDEVSPARAGATHDADGEVVADASDPSAPAASVEDLAEDDLAALKAAYLDVREALAEAQEENAAAADGTAEENAGSTAGQPADTARVPDRVDPLAQLLADATGDNVGDIQDVLQLVREVARQEHISATDQPTAGENTQATAETDAEADGASRPDQDAMPLWHDQADQWLGRMGMDDPAGRHADGFWHDRTARSAAIEQDMAEGSVSNSSVEQAEDGALLHRLAPHAAPVTLDTETVSAVDQFMEVIESLDLVTAHPHAMEMPQLETAA